MSRMRVGLIGCGNISTTYLSLAPLFRDIEIRAVADLDIKVARERADEHGVTAMTVEDLLAADLDIIVNLTVPAAHFAVTGAILEAGKHAYSEKPLALTLEEGLALKALAEAAGLRVGAAPDTFLGGSPQQARAMIDAGEIGRVTAGTAFVMGHGMEHWHPNPEFFFKPGGGPLLDMGPYYITALINLLGPARRVAALTGSARPTRTITSKPRAGEVIAVETPTTVQALIEFESGATVTLAASWDVWAHGHSAMELYGTGGALSLPDPNFFGGPLLRAKPGEALQEVAPWPHPFLRANQDTRANYRAAGLADMARAIREGRPHRCGLDAALHCLDIMASILRSGETGSFVALTTTCARPAALAPADAQALLA